jgi:hypothetical protein
LFHVDPDDIGLIREQVRKLFDCETFFDAIGIVPVKKNFHESPIVQISSFTLPVCGRAQAQR